MKRSCYFLASVSVSIVLLLAVADAYVYSGIADTTNGFCEEERYGRIPVGGEGYDDERCEKIECSDGEINGYGCSPASIRGRPNCRLVALPGHYPNCCRTHIRCDDDAEDGDSQNEQ